MVENLLTETPTLKFAVEAAADRIESAEWVTVVEISDHPMMRLRCRSEDLPLLLEAVYDTMTVGGQQKSGCCAPKISMERQREAPEGFAEFRLYSEDGEYFDKLAEAITK